MSGSRYFLRGLPAPFTRDSKEWIISFEKEVNSMCKN